MTILALASTIFFWASAFVGIKWALEGYSPVHLAIVRFIIASLALTIVALAYKLDPLERKDFPQFFLLGLIGITCYNLLLNYGEQTASAGTASFIINTVPIITIWLAILFLKEQIPQKAHLGTVIGLLGIAILCFTDNGIVSFNFGTLSILIAAIAQSLFFVVQKPMLRVYSALSVICYSIWIGTFCLLPLLFFYPFNWKTIPITNHLAVIYLGVFPGALGYLTWTFTLSKIPASQAASFLYLVPIVTIIIEFMVLQKVPSLATLLGGTTTILGIFIFNVIRNKQISTS